MQATIVEAHPGSELISEASHVEDNLGDIKLPWMQAVYSYEASHARKVQQVHSHLLLIEGRCWWMKYRVTVPEDQDAQSDIVGIAEYLVGNWEEPDGPCLFKQEDKPSASNQ